MSQYDLKAVGVLNLQSLSGNMNLDAGASNVVLKSRLGFSGVTSANIRTDLGLTIGSDVNAWSAKLDDIVNSATTANNVLVANGSTWVSNTPAQTRTALSLVPGTDVQVQSSRLNDLASASATDSNFLVGNGSTFVVESGATARASLGLSINSDVQAYSARLADVAAVGVTNNYLLGGNGTNLVLVSPAEVLTDLNAQPASDQLTDLADLGVVSGADKYIYSTGAGVYAYGTATAFGRSLIDDSASSNARTTLGLDDASAVVSFSTSQAKKATVQSDSTGQVEFSQLRASTANAIPVVMTLDGTLKNAIAIGQVSHFDIEVVGRNDHALQHVICKKFKFVGSRIDSATTAILSSNNAEEFYKKSGTTAGVDITVGANTTDFTFDVTVTGATAENWKWIGYVRRVNVTA